MKARRARRIGIVLTTLVLGFLAAFYVWSKPPRPETPVPALSILAGSGFQARLMSPQPGLTALPAQITGRAAAGDAPGSYLQEWPAFHASANFTGTAVTLRFDDPDNRWRVTLDGASVEISRPGRQDLRIEGLAQAPHLIRAEKTSESWQPAVFGGFLLDSDATALAPPKPMPRLIEFIGDSDTVGLGNTSRRRMCNSNQVFAGTDTSRSFGPLVAEAFGADYRIIARSGVGLLRNYDGVAPTRTMADIYPMALPQDAAALPLPARKADIVVIGLGSNDFASSLDDDERWQDKAALSADFGPALAAFATARAQENPDALIVLLAFGEYGHDLTGAYHQAADALSASGIPSRLITLGKPKRTACLWHPSASDHVRIAQTLIDGLSDLAPKK